jgi:hypothetical protein
VHLAILKVGFLAIWSIAKNIDANACPPAPLIPGAIAEMALLHPSGIIVGRCSDVELTVAWVMQYFPRKQGLFLAARLSVQFKTQNPESFGGGHSVPTLEQFWVLWVLF